MKLRITFIIVALLAVCYSCKKESGPTGPGNTAPVLTEIADQTVNAGETKNVGLSAVDQDGDALNFSIPLNPGFLSISGFSQTGDTASATLVIAPEDTILGNFNATVKVSDGKGGVDSTNLVIEVEEVKTTLFLRRNSSYYLSREQTPGPGADIVQFNYLPSNRTRDWKAILNDAITGTTYTFSLWMACNDMTVPGHSYFDVYLLINHNGIEKELAYKFFSVPYNEYYWRYSATIAGEQAGEAGDTLILRIYLKSGGCVGSMILGPDEYSDSHIIVPGDITVSMP